jgi:hypothetical protein
VIAAGCVPSSLECAVTAVIAAGGVPSSLECAVTAVIAAGGVPSSLVRTSQKHALMRPPTTSCLPSVATQPHHATSFSGTPAIDPDRYVAAYTCVFNSCCGGRGYCGGAPCVSPEQFDSKDLYARLRMALENACLYHVEQRAGPLRADTPPPPAYDDMAAMVCALAGYVHVRCPLFHFNCDDTRR